MTTTSSSVVPLTTRFNPPSSCLNTTPTLLVTLSTGTGYRYHQGPTNTAGCFPDGWSPTSYFSPGLCPSSYTIAHKSEVNLGTATETHAICCAGGLGIDPPKQTESLPWGEREPCASLLAHTATQENGNVINRAYYNGYGVHIRWQESDVATPTAMPSTSLDQSSSPAATSTSASSSSQVTGETKNGLSTGAKAGIGVGAAAGGLLLIMAVFALIWRRRKRAAPSEADERSETCTVPFDVPSVRDMRDLTGHQRLAVLNDTGYPMESMSENYSQTFSQSQAYSVSHDARSHDARSHDARSHDARSHDARSHDGRSHDGRSTAQSSHFTPDYANSWHRNVNSPAELDSAPTSRPQNWI